jgi:hypothetical protein
LGSHARVRLPVVARALEARRERVATATSLDKEEIIPAKLVIMVITAMPVPARGQKVRLSARILRRASTGWDYRRRSNVRGNAFYGRASANSRSKPGPR